MFRRITVGLKGGILRVASAAEVAAARLPLVVCGAPGCGRACPALGGLLILFFVLNARWDQADTREHVYPVKKDKVMIPGDLARR